MRYVRDAHHRHAYTVRKAHETSALLREPAATAGLRGGIHGGNVNTRKCSYQHANMGPIPDTETLPA